MGWLSSRSINIKTSSQSPHVPNTCVPEAYGDISHLHLDMESDYNSFKWFLDGSEVTSHRYSKIPTRMGWGRLKMFRVETTFTTVLSNYICTTDIIYDSAIIDVDLSSSNAIARNLALSKSKWNWEVLRLMKILDTLLHKRVPIGFQMKSDNGWL